MTAVARTRGGGPRGRNHGIFHVRFFLIMLVVAFCLALVSSLATAPDPTGFIISLGIGATFAFWITILALFLSYMVIYLWGAVAESAQLLVFFVSVQVLLLMSHGLLVMLNEHALVVGLLGTLDPPYVAFRNHLMSVVGIGFVAFHSHRMRLHRGQIFAESSALLSALQSRIRPHFLFNTLNTISSLIHDHPDQAEQATMDLADLLRTGLKDDSSHALADELELIRGYLRIEQLRLGDRLEVIWDLAEDLPLDQHLPPLLLQPLVENAVVHGISRRAEGGPLRIEGRRIRFGRIRFTVSNPLADPDSRPAEGSGSALENIRQRLALAYEERYGLKTGIDAGINDGIDNGRFIAALTIPVTA